MNLFTSEYKLDLDVDNFELAGYRHSIPRNKPRDQRSTKRLNDIDAERGQKMAAHSWLQWQFRLS
jgi:hypothetical protein